MASENKSCLVVDLGLIGYAHACELQQRTVAARKAGTIGDVLFICEHPHVITLGRNGKQANLLASDHVLRQMNVEFHESDRGGDITYHGPGQVVGYPILNLAEIRRDVGWYMRQLEEVMIQAGAAFGVTAERREGITGIWVTTPRGAGKLGAIGVHLSRWITSHGFAYNAAVDLRYFELIVPCGLTGKQATSLEKLLDRPVPAWAAAETLVAKFGEVFGMTMRTATRAELDASLSGQPSDAAAAS